MYFMSFLDLRGANSDQRFQRFASAAAFIANFILLVQEFSPCYKVDYLLRQSLNVIFGYI